jgi:hypothetical protein
MHLIVNGPYKLLAVLIFFLLFFQSWMHLRRMITGSMKAMILSFLIIALLAPGLSRVHVRDRFSLQEKVMQENPLISHNVDLPEVTDPGYIPDSRLVPEFVLHSDSTSLKLVSVTNGDNFVLSQLPDWISMRYIEEEMPLLHCRFYIDKDEVMKNVFALTDVLAKMNMRHVFWAVKSDENEGLNCAVRASLIFNDENSLEMLKADLLRDENEGLIDIDILDKHTMLLNDVFTTSADLPKMLTKQLSKHAKNLIVLKLDKRADFEYYIQVLSEIEGICDRHEFADDELDYQSLVVCVPYKTPEI